MTLSRREALKGMLLGSAATILLPRLAYAALEGATPELADVVLSNGLRLHCFTKRSGYVSAALVLRSKEIGEPGGLAHLMEHTSFTGAAGSFTASQVKRLRQDCMQDSNATTGLGKIEWTASFLPRNTARALEMLAVTSLDQKFDVETVEQEARIVLQELYLIKYDANGRAKQRFDQALYGKSHPYARDTVETEITKAKTPPQRLARELAAFSETIKLPCNMDLFLVGDIDADQVQALAEEHFGRYPFAVGPVLDLPRTQVTRAYNAFSADSSDLKGPLSELKIAWNTGVRVTDPDAKVLLALGGYLNEALNTHIREKLGNAYTPEATFQPDRCGGIFEVAVTSSKPPEIVETGVFETIAMLKRHIDPVELERFRDRFELMRRKKSQSNDSILEDLVSKTLDGASVYDFDMDSVTPEDLLAAARKYLPSHKGGYVRLALIGR